MARGDDPVYVSHAVDRLAHRRNDAVWLAGVWQRDDVWLLPFWGHRPAIAAGPRLALTPARRGRELRDAARQWVLLGALADRPVIALDLSEMPETDAVAGVGAPFADPRQVAADLPAVEAALLAQGRALFIWHRRHRFCGLCGQPTRAEAAGHVRRCVNDACAAPQFPRSDPAVIMLVTDGDYCLLARGRQLPAGMVSTLAGFVEPGESLEQAVMREVGEEVGLQVGRPRYVASQPWPYPASLMLGFEVTAQSREIVCDADEIDFADWFHRDRLDRLAIDGLRLPRRDSIAAMLIDRWRRG